MIKIKKDRTGMKYGHWIVIGLDEEKTANSNRPYWICKCDCGCGTQKSLRADALVQVTIGGCNNIPSDKPKICEKCGKEFYPKKQAKVRKYCYDCYPEESSNDGASIRRLAKKWAIDYKGGKCERCGYNKCVGALDFHHVNGKSDKNFILSDKNLKLDWEIIKAELDKCELLCANCHREVHYAEEKE